MSFTLRFAVVGDLHWTQNNGSVSPGGYAARISALITALEAENTADGLDFIVFNGDLIHDDPNDLSDLKIVLDGLTVPYYVVYGNHDRATDSAWNTLWGYTRSHSFESGNYAIICPATSNTSGDYLAVDTTWLQNQIDSFSAKTGIFIICHIQQDNVYAYGVNAPAVRTIFENTANLKGVFYSHNHNENHVYYVDAGDVKYCFTGHCAHWGLNYYSYRIVEIT